jgi:hypothetical protein
MGHQPTAWYSAHLIYAVAVSRTSGAISIDDDLCLFEAASADDAFETAVSAAGAGERMGKAILAGTAAAFREDGLQRFVDAFFPVGGTSQLPVSNRTMYEFLGLSDLRYVGSKLSHGTEVERYRVRSSEGENMVVPARSDLLAFDPSGPIFSGAERREEKARLIRDSQWYLAEEIFTLGLSASSKISASDPTERWKRLVLIQSSSPERAYESALRDGESRPEGFLGILELSLIYGGFNGLCNLTTYEYTLSKREAEELVKPKSQLSALKTN